MKRIFIPIIGLLFLIIPYATAALVDNGDGTVTDDIKGLMWQQEDDNAPRTWESAISYCESQSLANYTDWRMPTLKELRSIVEKSKFSPAIDSAFFPNTNSSAYWTSKTAPAVIKTLKWNVDFFGGDDTYTDMSVFNYIRCVRGGE